MEQGKSQRLDQINTGITKPVSAWEPLKIPLFRSLWIANTASNIGTWIQDVGGAWYMTSITDSAVYIALMQTATSFPLFLLALPAGVASDLYDRRKILIWTLVWIVISALILGLLILSGLSSPVVLLVLTVILNLGGAFFVPAWQATIPELVPKDQLSGAIAINSASLNVARAVGPAIGGLMLASFGAWATYFLNATVTAILIVLLIRWKRNTIPPKLPPEQFFAAVKMGIRYVRHSTTIKTLLLRTLVFIIPASALFAMLPIVVKNQLGFGATIYGILLGFIGIGALLGVYFLPKIRAKVSINILSVISSALVAVAILGLSLATYVPLLSILMVAGGLGWLLTLSSFHVTTMSSVPSWVRGRAVAVYLLIFYGGMSSGAALWGFLATEFGTNYSLIAAGVFLLLATMLAGRFKLPNIEKLDLDPGGRWAEPMVVREFDPNDQAVMVTVEYHIDSSQQQAFKAAMHQLREIRQRDGAFSWMLTEDVADSSRYLEVFYVESWLEHLHQHQRGTVEDQAIENVAKGFHIREEAIKVTHLLISKSR
jgi:MFS family permease